jgi:hypothetical protein
MQTLGANNFRRAHSEIARKYPAYKVKSKEQRDILKQSPDPEKKEEPDDIDPRCKHLRKRLRSAADMARPQPDYEIHPENYKMVPGPYKSLIHGIHGDTKYTEKQWDEAVKFLREGAGPLIRYNSEFYPDRSNAEKPTRPVPVPEAKFTKEEKEASRFLLRHDIKLACIERGSIGRLARRIYIDYLRENHLEFLLRNYTVFREFLALPATYEEQNNYMRFVLKHCRELVPETEDSKSKDKSKKHPMTESEIILRKVAFFEIYIPYEEEEEREIPTAAAAPVESRPRFKVDSLMPSDWSTVAKTKKTKKEVEELRKKESVAAPSVKASAEKSKEGVAAPKAAAASKASISLVAAKKKTQTEPKAKAYPTGLAANEIRGLSSLPPSQREKKASERLMEDVSSYRVYLSEEAEEKEKPTPAVTTETTPIPTLQERPKVSIDDIEEGWSIKARTKKIKEAVELAKAIISKDKASETTQQAAETILNEDKQPETITELSYQEIAKERYLKAQIQTRAKQTTEEKPVSKPQTTSTQLDEDYVKKAKSKYEEHRKKQLESSKSGTAEIIEITPKAKASVSKTDTITVAAQAQKPKESRSKDLPTKVVFFTPEEIDMMIDYDDEEISRRLMEEKAKEDEFLLLAPDGEEAELLPPVQNDPAQAAANDDEQRNSGTSESIKNNKVRHVREPGCFVYY